MSEKSSLREIDKENVFEENLKINNPPHSTIETEVELGVTEISYPRGDDVHVIDNPWGTSPTKIKLPKGSIVMLKYPNYYVPSSYFADKDGNILLIKYHGYYSGGGKEFNSWAWVKGERSGYPPEFIGEKIPDEIREATAVFKSNLADVLYDKFGTGEIPALKVHQDRSYEGTNRRVCNRDFGIQNTQKCANFIEFMRRYYNKGSLNEGYEDSYTYRLELVNYPQ